MQEKNIENKFSIFFNFFLNIFFIFVVYGKMSVIFFCTLFVSGMLPTIIVRKDNRLGVS